MTIHIPGTAFDSLQRIRRRLLDQRRRRVVLLGEGEVVTAALCPVSACRGAGGAPARGARPVDRVTGDGVSAVVLAEIDGQVADERDSLRARLNPTTSVLTQVYAQAQSDPKRVIFAEAEEEVVLRAAIQFRDFGYGIPVLVGRTPAVQEKLLELGISNPDSFEIHNSAVSPLVPAMVDALSETPVIAAGGIGDRRGIHAALALGAGAAQLGTAFLACAESGTTVTVTRSGKTRSGSSTPSRGPRAGPTGTKIKKVFRTKTFSQCLFEE
mgnify:CR=1 FL=1